jgi:hypothetical protein
MRGVVARRACYKVIDERIYHVEYGCNASVYFCNLLSFNKIEVLFRACSLKIVAETANGQCGRLRRATLTKTTGQEGEARPVSRVHPKGDNC